MSQASNNLYRKEALDRLSSPEQLDEAIIITGSGSWVALIGLLLLAASFVAWALYGSVPTRIQGQGMLFSGGGQIIDAVSVAAGTLSQPLRNIGNQVSAGELLAEIAQPDVAQKLAAARGRLQSLKDALTTMEADQQRLGEARRANAKAREAAYDDQIDAARQRQSAYQTQLTNQERLAAVGVVTVSAVQQVREQLSRANQDLVVARSSQLGVTAEMLVADADDQRASTQQKRQIADAQADVDQLELQSTTFGKVVSPANGTLVEWKAPFGTYTPSGSRIASIATGKGDLQFMLYVPPTDGKRVQVGMTVNVELSGLQKEQWGTLIGQVVSVSAFPSTSEGMRAVMQNDTLVARFSQQGAPFAVLVALQADPSTASGYRWSGGSGAALALSAGTTGVANVTIETRNPISFLLPFLRRMGAA